MSSNFYQPPSAALGAELPPSTERVAPGVIASFAHVRPWLRTLAMALAGCALVVVGGAFASWRFRGGSLPVLLALAVFGGFLLAAAWSLLHHSRDVARLLGTGAGADLDEAVVSLGEVWRVLGVMVLTAIALAFGLRYALPMFLST